jgi:hypothetical protein
LPRCRLVPAERYLGVVKASLKTSSSRRIIGTIRLLLPIDLNVNH